MIGVVPSTIVMLVLDEELRLTEEIEKRMKRKKPKRAATAETSSGTEVCENVPTTITDIVQDIIRKRLSQTSLPPEITGFEQERIQLYELLKRTVTVGESNSVLLIGPRGGGKSMLLNSVLNELGSDENFDNDLLQVHLNGLLQTDDRIALKEITRQLKLENTVGDRVFGSFSETLQFLLDALKSGDQSSKPVLFVLDEFDLFAHHRNQTLLYNLFDISQSAQTPICVLGITCRLDVIELLEKRVKSRFSHRQIHLFNNLTFDRYCDLFCSYLTLSNEFPDKKFAKDWNKNVAALSKDKTVVDILQRQFNFNKDIRMLQQLMLSPVIRISETSPQLLASHFVDSMKLMTTDSKSAMLHGVSVLELCLIIAMKHLTDIYDGEPFNFEMVYNEYQKFAHRRSSMQVFEKSVVLKAFEHLLALELVKPMDSGGTRIQKEYRLMSLLIHPSQILDALQKYPNCPTEVKQWANSALA
ncbi:hypothetical protein ScPMuIL_011783 [Solemya velum]